MNSKINIVNKCKVKEHSANESKLTIILCTVDNSHSGTAAFRGPSLRGLQRLPFVDQESRNQAGLNKTVSSTKDVQLCH